MNSSASDLGTGVSAGVGSWWDAITAGFTRSAGVDSGVGPALLIIGLPLVVTLVPQIWRYFGLYVTFVHELGHAFAALLTGRIVKGISLNFDHSGQMNSFGRVGFSAQWSGFWGYPAPAVFGLVLIAASVFGWGGPAMSLGALVLLVALLFIRNLAGVVIALVTAVLAQLIVVFVPVEWISVFIAALGTALAIGALKDLVKVIGVHTGRRDVRQSDAYILGRSSAVPATMWLVLFAVVILACTVGSAWLLYAALVVR